MPQTLRNNKRKSLYSVHPSVAMVQDWIARLKDKTGRTLEEWIELIQKSGPATEKECREWLKKEYNLGTNSAWWLAERAAGKGAEGDDPKTSSKPLRNMWRLNTPVAKLI